MRDFGIFLANLRSSAGLSLEDLARLVDSSKSTLSRLENNDIPQPFKGTMHKLIIALAEILCTSQKDTERLLYLAGINRSLLTEFDEFQLGFSPRAAAGSTDEIPNLERWKLIYEELLKRLEAKETEFGVTDSPPNLKLKIQEYSNVLNEIQKRMERFSHITESTEAFAPSAKHLYHAEAQGGRTVVGSRYGEEFMFVPPSGNLYTLASENARWLMQLAGVERFAVDDCILLANSENFKGWVAHEIKTTILNVSLPIPDDLAQLKQEKLPTIEKYYANAPHYRLVSATPAFSELDHLKISMSPLGFYDYFSLTPFFDEPLLTALDGSKVSIRQKYGNTALMYSSTDKGTSLIPTPISVQCIIVTKDRLIIMMQRSLSVAFYPHHWSVSFEETMNAPIVNPEGEIVRMGDADFFAAAMRGLEEEFAIPTDAVERIQVLSLNVEYLTLSVDVITLITVDLTAEAVRRHWLLQARHRDEASLFAIVSIELKEVVNKLFSKTLWHPTSRMRLIQFLFHRYGVNEVVSAIRESSQEQRA